jgi:cardiolipin synthase A/B
MFFESAGILVVVEVVLILLAVVVVPRGRRPSSALAWILLIILFPVIGALFFLVVGSPKLPQQRRDMQRSMDERIEERAADVGQVSAEHPAPPWLPSVARLNQTVGAMPLLEDNDAHVLPRFEEQLSALIAAVDESRRYAHVEFYILSLDASTAPFFAALEAAVSRGVQVRVQAGSLGVPRLPGLPQDLPGAGPDRCRLAPDAASAAAPWALSASGPAQPSQAARRRR